MIEDMLMSIWNWFSMIYKALMSFFNPIISFLKSVVSIVDTLWYWITSLLSWIWKLIVQVFEWWVFNIVWEVFSYISNYIWVPAVIFISTLLLIAVVRIWIAFVFKMMRLNIDYKPNWGKPNTYNITNNFNKK